MTKAKAKNKEEVRRCAICSVPDGDALLLTIILSPTIRERQELCPSCLKQVIDDSKKLGKKCTVTVTFKDLQRIMKQQQENEQRQQEDSPEMKQLLERVQGKPFWQFTKTGHGGRSGLYPSSTNCCFNHIINLPKKGNQEYPLFDYEHIVYRCLQEPGFLNARSATEEEENQFSQLKIEIENTVNSKTESIAKAQKKTH